MTSKVREYGSKQRIIEFAELLQLLSLDDISSNLKAMRDMNLEIMVIEDNFLLSFGFWFIIFEYQTHVG